MTITTAADDILNFFFSVFRETKADHSGQINNNQLVVVFPEHRVYISPICIESHTLLSGKQNMNMFFLMSSAEMFTIHEKVLREWVCLVAFLLF